MEGGSSMNGETRPQLLDLIPKEREWLMMRESGERRHHGSSEEKKLELRLGPPGGEDWSLKDNNNRERDESLLSLSYFSSMNNNQNNNKNQNSNGFSFLQFPTSTKTSQTAPQSLPVMGKESSQPCCTKVVDLQSATTAEKKAFSSSPVPAKNTAVSNSSQKRTAPSPVVGWPPIRSFRKNLASTSASKPSTESSPNGVVVSNKSINEKPVEHIRKNMFVKINMDGVPIGRKVDLSAYHSYDKLSTAVDQLFRGLLAAQRDSSAGGMVNKQEEEKAITGVLDGSGEYTLVYEDNEGDRMLVGDVPWHMFVSTVKRLRVLKSSEVSALSLGSSKQAKLVA
ncbi:hypothetical protein LWI28_021210 [Acer negundo]|uniref:Auxin-responsive protein n=1 Tax=Acer negundo TaxID=4023 RepID=A0AAD5IGG0_ACENE|nr:hypothetical protein LWI28_021210 [Acer negundo]KAK4838048.1 hypothetical protein QYF36_010556 [Acer negundo]